MDALKTLGRYTIEARLGSGSYATVYRALDTRLKRVVALKVLKSTLASDEEIAGRFLREAQTAANLIHPQIAWVLDLGDADGQHYIAMRYIEGMPLDKVIEERGRLMWRDALQVIVQIGSALEFAHERGAIHRDIKPQNILFSPTEGAVLTDFGLVKAAQASGTRTRTDAVLGTPQYIAPEMWSDQPASPASDQYALACVFVEMLTGQPLYAGKSLVDIINKHLKPSDGLVWGTWPEDVPPGIDPVLQRALARNPEHRFRDIRTFIENVVQIDWGAKQAPGNKESVAHPLLPLINEKHDIAPVEPTEPVDPNRTEKVSPIRVRQKAGDTLAKGRAAEKKPVYQLTITSGPLRGKAFRLTAPRNVIGRNPGCDIIIDDLEVSRKHVVITQAAQGFMIEDLKSTNGTFINNRQIHQTQSLKPGDEIRLGKSVRLVLQKADVVH